MIDQNAKVKTKTYLSTDKDKLILSVFVDRLEIPIHEKQDTFKIGVQILDEGLDVLSVVDFLTSIVQIARRG